MFPQSSFHCRLHFPSPNPPVAVSRGQTHCCAHPVLAPRAVPGAGRAVLSPPTLDARSPGCPAWVPSLLTLRISGSGVKQGDSFPRHPMVGGVLTGAVLVPGMAADGLHQEAVIGHGCSAPVPKTEREARSAPPCPASLAGGQPGGHPGLPTLA